MSFLAYFLTMLSSPKRNNDLLTVKQFCRTGMGLYRAIVRARCALVCLKAPGDPPAGAAAPCRLRFCSEPPSPEPSLPATASPKRAILQESAQVSRAAPPRRRGGGGEQGGLRGSFLLLLLSGDAHPRRSRIPPGEHRGEGAAQRGGYQPHPFPPLPPHPNHWDPQAQTQGARSPSTPPHRSPTAVRYSTQRSAGEAGEQVAARSSLVEAKWPTSSRRLHLRQPPREPPGPSAGPAAAEGWTSAFCRNGAAEPEAAAPLQLGAGCL